MDNDKPNVSSLKSNLFRWCKPKFPNLYDWIAKNHWGKNLSSDRLLRKRSPNRLKSNGSNTQICSITSNLKEHTLSCSSYASIILSFST